MLWRPLRARFSALVAGAQEQGAAPKDKALIDKLYQQIGQLQVELEWLKKTI